MLFGNAVELAQMTFCLIPKALYPIDVVLPFGKVCAVVDAEAARDKFPHFLRKTLWKFVALFATLLHFLQKRHFCRFLFYQLHMAISPLVLPVLLLPME